MPSIYISTYSLFYTRLGKYICSRPDVRGFEIEISRCISQLKWFPCLQLITGRTTDMARTAADAPAMREALLVMFSEALGGDRDAAEYLLLHMLSYVYVRDTLTGKFSLNLKGVTSGTCRFGL